MKSLEVLKDVSEKSSPKGFNTIKLEFSVLSSDVDPCLQAVALKYVTPIVRKKNGVTIFKEDTKGRNS